MAAAAFESSFHDMGSPASTGTTLAQATGNLYFGEREAVKLFFMEGGAVTDEQADAHGTASLDGAQEISLASLKVLNTLAQGLNAGKNFIVNAAAVAGYIAVVDGASEHDFYRFDGLAGDLLNLEVASRSLSLVADVDKIDSIIRVYDDLGNVVAANDDHLDSGKFISDSLLIDLVLPHNGVYYVEVTTFSSLGLPDASGEPPPAQDGYYELFLYRFDVAAASDAGDTLEGRSGDDSMNGGAGNEFPRTTPISPSRTTPWIAPAFSIPSL